MDKSGSFRVYLAITTEMVEEARKIHDTTPLSTAGLGRVLTGAGLMGLLLKGKEDKLTVQFKGDGPAKQILATANASGCVKGYIANPDADLPLKENGKLDVGGSLGIGELTVIKDLGLKEPYVSSIALVSGEIAEDLTAYLLESEQVPSACGLGVLIDTDLSVKAAGGFIVQLMPGAPDEYIDVLEENIFMMDQLTTILSEDGLEAVFEQVLKGLPYHIVDEDEVGYRCYCSRERVGDAILGVGEDELESMINEGKDIDVSCQFCDTVYTFTPDDLRKLLDESKKA